MGVPEVEDALPRDEHVVEHDDGVHLIPKRAEGMVLGVGRRQRLAADEMDAVGVDRHGEVDNFLGLEVGPRRRQTEELVGVGRLRPHPPGPPHDDAVGTPLHHSQVLLIGRGVAPEMQGIAKNGGDADVVLAAGLDVVDDAGREGWVHLAQKGAHVIESDHHCGEVLW
jgi:hypothetical protein